VSASEVRKPQLRLNPSRSAPLSATTQQIAYAPSQPSSQPQSRAQSNESLTASASASVTAESVNERRAKYSRGDHVEVRVSGGIEWYSAVVTAIVPHSSLVGDDGNDYVFYRVEYTADQRMGHPEARVDIVAEYDVRAIGEANKIPFAVHNTVWSHPITASFN